MTGIGTLASEARNVSEFVVAYFRRLAEVLQTIDPQAVERFETVLLEAREDQRTIFVAGNGGSATTAATMENDWGSDVLRKAGARPFRVRSLAEGAGTLTALANDVGYERVFLDQLRVHYRPGDVLVVISGSGNSPNLVKAAEWVLEQGGRVLGLVGFDGGRLLELCTVAVHVKTERGEYGPVEDAHLAVNHVLSHWFQAKLRRGESG